MATESSPDDWKKVAASGALDGDWLRTYEYLARSGPKSGGELNMALGKSGKDAAFHRRAAELHAVGCLDKRKRASEKGRNAGSEYVVNGNPPDREKLAVFKRRLETDRPNTKTFIRGVKDILALCRDMRSKQPEYTFTPELIAVTRWLRLAAESRQKERDTRKAERSKAAEPTGPQAKKP